MRTDQSLVSRAIQSALFVVCDVDRHVLLDVAAEGLTNAVKQFLAPLSRMAPLEKFVHS